MQISFIFICLVLSSLGIQRFLDEFFEPISINTELLLDSSFRNRSLSNTLSLSDALKLRVLDKIEYESKNDINLFDEKHIRSDELWNLSIKTDPNMFIFESNLNTLNIFNIQNFLLFNSKYELTIPAFSMFQISEPFLYGGFSQLNRKKNIKNLCFLNEIDGYISLSAINYDENINVAVIFYTKNIISKTSEYFSIKYFLRYYVLDNIPCSNQIDSSKISFFFEINSNKTYIPYTDIELTNSSMINYIDLEKDFIIYSKEIDVYLFRSLKRERNVWIEEFAKPDQNDQHLNKFITRTLAIKLLSKYIEESRRLLVFTVQKNYKEIYFKCDLYKYGEKNPLREDYMDNKNYKWEISSNLIKRDIDFDVDFYLI